MSSDLTPARSREPVVNHVYRELRQAILQGRLAPQERLVETVLAEMLDVSRTPVREAISRLESDGLVSRLRGGGVTVGDTLGTLAESIIIRQGLEGTAARLVCERADEATLLSIRAACEAAELALGTATLEQRSTADRNFHMSIARASGSVRLVNLIGEFYEHSFSEIMPQLQPGKIEQLQEQHSLIVATLLVRDATRAEAMMRQHLESVLSIIREVPR